ncbi:unnamed protein product [Ranitomeya imitator]|uniref:S-adenosylmethionine synthase n=1 Tax=Ranitomeya imitator TaxID=111125 RepID=A0ABN9M8A3_9NEOB|nr:unnamed protein product [Ranitomeya imitator]
MVSHLVGEDTGVLPVSSLAHSVLSASQVEVGPDEQPRSHKGDGGKVSQEVDDDETQLPESQDEEQGADVEDEVVDDIMTDPTWQEDMQMKYIQQNGAVIPVRVHTIVISVQHDETVSLSDMQEALKNKVIKAVVPDKYLDEKTIYHLQPSGRFVIGGPQGDAGVTGRKIIVDTYGGWGAHGGGAFSGKDYTKVDRSAAYAARWVAKSLVHSKLCHRVLVQVSYAIGVAQPLSVSLFTYGTSEKKTEKELLDIVNKNFDLRPGVIVRDLDLKKPLYQNTACYGHFGREGFSWEVPKELIF